MIDQRPGGLTLQVNGPDVHAAFADEAGGHRWQRVPPTEKRGRVHTSTVTVAVLPEPVLVGTRDIVDAKDLEWAVRRASGPGGQGVNRTESAVTLVHRPTGLTVRCQTERSQHRNKASALAVLRARLWERQRAATSGCRAADRRAQVGTGQRGDKRRTIRLQDGQVHDHVTGRRWPLAAYLAGEW